MPVSLANGSSEFGGYAANHNRITRQKAGSQSESRVWSGPVIRSQPSPARTAPNHGASLIDLAVVDPCVCTNPAQGKQKKTRRFAETKRLINPKDTRL